MAIVDTTSPAYQNYLSQLRQIYTLARNYYGAPSKRMTRQQLVALYNADPLFKELVDMAKDLNDVAERVGVEL